MKLVSLINTLLSYVNLAVTRRSNLNHLQAIVHQLQQQQETQSARFSLPNDFFKEMVRHQISQKWSLADFMDNREGGDDIHIRICPLCGHKADDTSFRKMRSHCIFGGGHLLRHVCPACAVIFGPDKMFRMTAEELSQEYEWHYKAYSEGDSTAQELRAFHALAPSKSGIYVNYGAGGWSRSVAQLRSEGWNVWAYEPHHSAAKDGEGLIRTREQLHSMHFDGIFSNNVLEHLRFPELELVQMSKLLKPEARMAHATPCYEYMYEYTRFHLFFFTDGSRQSLLRRARLRELDFIRDQEFMCSIMTPEISPS